MSSCIVEAADHIANFIASLDFEGFQECDKGDGKQ